MENPTLRERYKALESATACRLSTFNTLIKEERALPVTDKEKVDYLKDKRKVISQELNRIRECLKKDDISVLAYQDIKHTYLAFQTLY